MRVRGDTAGGRPASTGPGARAERGPGRSLGRPFGWLWASYAVSSAGTRLAFNALPTIAVLVLHAGPTAVAALAAAGLAVGAAVAVPLGPWVEHRPKRPVMIAADLARCAALGSVPVAHLLGLLTFAQLVVVSVAVGAADIAFTAASGAFLKALVPPERLLTANARFESTAWTATVLGPPLGGAAVGLFGPVATVLADAVSYLLSAAGIRAIGPVRPVRPVRPPTGSAGPAASARTRVDAGGEMGTPASGARAPAGRPASGVRAPAPGRPTGPAAARLRRGDLLEGWRYLLTHPALRPLFLNTVLVNALIMATEPLLVTLMLGPLGFAPWQFGLAFAAPCLGGLVGSRLARPLAARFGAHRVLRAAGALRACWVLGLALVRPGVPGLVLVIGVELGLITCAGVFNPLSATYRLDRIPSDRVARTLAAWSVSTKAGIAAATALWGVLAGAVGPRTALALAGGLLLASPLLLPRAVGPRPAGARPEARA